MQRVFVPVFANDCSTFFLGSLVKIVFTRDSKYTFTTHIRAKNIIKVQAEENATVSKENYKDFVKAFEMTSADKMIQVLCLA